MPAPTTMPMMMLTASHIPRRAWTGCVVSGPEAMPHSPRFKVPIKAAVAARADRRQQVAMLFYESGPRERINSRPGRTLFGNMDARLDTYGYNVATAASHFRSAVVTFHELS